MLQGKSAEVRLTSTGEWAVMIVPTGRPIDLVVGDRAFIVQFFPRAGQFQYPSGSARCGVVERTQNGISIVEVTQLCELQLASPFEFASANGVCDGTVGGEVQAVFGSAPVAATFVTPVKLAAPTSTRCGGTGESCRTDSDCCAQSCSPAIGVCN